MRCERDSFVLPPAVAAARRRTPRHLRKTRPSAPEVENNYIAESSLTSGKTKRNRKRPGAPPGNLNALKHGAHRAGARALRAEVWHLLRAARLLLKMRKAFVELQKVAP